MAETKRNMGVTKNEVGAMINALAKSLKSRSSDLSDRAPSETTYSMKLDAIASEIARIQALKSEYDAYPPG